MGALPPFPYAAILRLIGPQTKRAAVGRLHPGYSGGPGKLLPQSGQAGVHISRPPTSGSDKQATNEQRDKQTTNEQRDK